MSNNLLPLPGPIALGAAAGAEANVGVREDAAHTNHGKWVEMYLASVGLDGGAPWCAAFVHYRVAAAAKEIGHGLPSDFPASGWCPDYQEWGQKHKLWISAVSPERFQVQRGDLCLFWFPAKERVAHIGIIVEAHADYYITVEGNTNDGTGVQREGDGVYRRKRLWSSFGYGGGFVRLPF